MHRKNFFFSVFFLSVILTSSVSVKSSGDLIPLALLDNNSLIDIGWHLKQINITKAWELTMGDPSITVAVIDTGIDFTHHEIKHAKWINTDEIPNNGKDNDNNGFVDDIDGWDFTSNDNNPGMEPTDPIHWHATVIAGVIAAEIDNEGIAGVAPNVTIMDLRVLDKDGYQATPALGGAIYYAVNNGADVINLSLQYYSNSSFLYKEIRYAYEHNVPIVSISGNIDVSQGGGSEIPSFPGAYNEVITVGATNYYYKKADYSNYGRWVDIVAPVGDEAFDSLTHVIRSTIPFDNYGYGVGTSFAAPQVSAVIALMKSVNPTLTIEQIKSILYSTAIDIGEPGKDKYFGYGLLNAAAAVEKAKEMLQQQSKTNVSLWISVTTLFLVSCILIKKKVKYRL